MERSWRYQNGKWALMPTEPTRKLTGVVQTKTPIVELLGYSAPIRIGGSGACAILLYAAETPMSGKDGPVTFPGRDRVPEPEFAFVIVLDLAGSRWYIYIEDLPSLLRMLNELTPLQSGRG